MKRRAPIAVLCAAGLTASLASSLTGTASADEGSLTEEVQVYAVAMRVLGKGARFARAGVWGDLADGTALRLGDVVEAKRDAVDVQLVAEEVERPGGGPRFALDKGAQVTLGSFEDPDLDLTLDDGRVAVLTAEPVHLRAGEALIEVEGQAEVEKRGVDSYDVSLFAGRLAITIGGDRHDVPEGHKVTLRKGKVSKPKRLRGSSDLLDSVYGKGVGVVLFQERIAGNEERYACSMGARGAGCLTGTPPKDKGAFEHRLRFSRTGGLWDAHPDARLRLHVRLVPGGPMMLHSWNQGMKALFKTDPVPVAEGVSWVDIPFADFHLHNGKGKKGDPLQPGTAMTTLEFFAGRRGAPGAFELYEIQVYLPR